MASAHFTSAHVCRWQRAQPHLCGLDGSGRVEHRHSSSAVGKWTVGLSSHSSPVSRLVCLLGLPSSRPSSCRVIKGESLSALTHA